jgi:hypothetical protein
MAKAKVPTARVARTLTIRKKTISPPKLEEQKSRLVDQHLFESKILYFVLGFSCLHFTGHLINLSMRFVRSCAPNRRRSIAALAGRILQMFTGLFISNLR